MFNLDKILKRSLSDDTKGMKARFEYYIQIDNGVDLLFIYLTKNELKKLTTKNSDGTKSLSLPYEKISNLWNEYYKKVGDRELLMVENLVNRTDIEENFKYDVYISNNNIKSMTYKELQAYAKASNRKSTFNDEYEYTNDFAQFFTKEEFEKIINGEIVLFQTVDRTLMVAVDN